MKTETRHPEVGLPDAFLNPVGLAFHEHFGDDIISGRHRVRVTMVDCDAKNAYSRYLLARTYDESDGTLTGHAMILDRFSFDIYPLATSGFMPFADAIDVASGRVAAHPRFFEAEERRDASLRSHLIGVMSQHRFAPTDSSLCACGFVVPNWTLRIRMLMGGNEQERESAYVAHEAHVADILVQDKSLKRNG